MDMWNWLMECYNEGSLTIEDLELVMEDKRAAKNLWEEWSADSNEFIDYVRDEVFPFLLHVKKKDE